METEHQQEIMESLKSHEALFLQMTSTLSAISERLTNYPIIVEMTNKNTFDIMQQFARCADIQKTKLSRQQFITQIKLIVISVVIAAILSVGTTLMITFFS